MGSKKGKAESIASIITEKKRLLVETTKKVMNWIPNLKIYCDARNTTFTYNLILGRNRY